MTEVAGCKREDLSIDQHLALRTASSRLGEQFAGIFEHLVGDSAIAWSDGSEPGIRRLLDELEVPAGRA